MLEKVEREAEEAARNRAEDQMRVESDRIRIQAQKREERVREATEDEIKASVGKARREAAGGRRGDRALLAARRRVQSIDRRLPHFLI